MNVELDILMKGIASKYFAEYLEAICKPQPKNNEVTQLIESIKRSDLYSNVKDELRQTYTGREKLLNAQLGLILLSDMITELIEEIEDI